MGGGFNAKGHIPSNCVSIRSVTRITAVSLERKINQKIIFVNTEERSLAPYVNYRLILSMEKIPFDDAYSGIKRREKKGGMPNFEGGKCSTRMYYGRPTFYDMDRKKEESFHRLQIERETTEVIKRRQGLIFFFFFSVLFSLGKNYESWKLDELCGHWNIRSAV